MLRVRAPTTLPAAVAWSVLLGVGIPLFLVFLNKLYDRFGFFNPYYGMIMDRIALSLWPSSLLLLADRPGVAGAILGAISISINVILYCLLGSMIWYGAARHRPVLIVPTVLIAALWILIWGS